MSGPNDSGASSPGDLPPPPLNTGPQPPSERFRLRIRFDTPQLEWRPMKVDPEPTGEPRFLKLDDPFAALGHFKSYIEKGGYQADLQAARFDLIDKAFLQAPTDPPKLIPSFAQLKAWEDAEFYKRMGRPAPLLGAPMQPGALTVTPPLPVMAREPFFKVPDPSTMRGEPAAPKPGAAGDVMKAFMAEPGVKRIYDKLGVFGLYQLDLLGREWKAAPWRDRITAIVLFAPLPATLVGGVLGNNEARHFAFNNLKGVDIPVPFLRGFSARIDGFGKADQYLLGTKPNEPTEFKFGLTFDVLKALPDFAKKF